MQALLLPAHAHDTRGFDREAFEVGVILRCFKRELTLWIRYNPAERDRVRAQLAVKMAAEGQ